MIGWLRGETLHHMTNGAVVVDVHGVGYEVHVATPEPTVLGASIELFIYTVVRDDAIQLFGFPSREEREFFELLISTPGVGPATALGALRMMSVAELARAVEAGDVKKISTISGIGPKTAGRIVLELKGKVLLEGSGGAGEHAEPVSEAIDEALRTLGYTGPEIRDALKDVTLPENENEALRAALQLLRR